MPSARSGRLRSRGAKGCVLPCPSSGPTLSWPRCKTRGGAGVSDDPGRGCHDIGGLPAGRIERAEHAHSLWEKRADALMVLLASRERRVITVDELRRGIEQLGAEAYDAMSYYERWVASITNTLLNKGVISADELGRRMAEVEARGEDAG